MPGARLETLIIDRLPTPIGELLVATDTEGVLRAVDWHDHEPRMRRLMSRHYGDVTCALGRAPAKVRGAFAAYFGGEAGALADLRWRTNGTDFQRAVWAALSQIPVGWTLSYGALAEAIGAPKAVRAVGLANGANPISLVAPCHRVIGSNGALTGYGGGLARKRWLLVHEGAMSDPGDRGRGAFPAGEGLD